MRVFFISLTISLLTLISVRGQSSLNFTSESMLYRVGLERLNQGKYLAAANSFEHYLAQGADPIMLADAQYYVAFCALQLKNQNGEALIEEFIEAHPNHTKALKFLYQRLKAIHIASVLSFHVVSASTFHHLPPRPISRSGF